MSEEKKSEEGDKCSSMAHRNSMMRRTTAYGNQPPWARPKTGRRLTFADETGESLYEVTYSEQTHYSRDADPSAEETAGKGGCCIVS